MIKFRFDEATKAQFRTVAKSKPTFRCEKHTRYNPAHGRGAIIGRCSGCETALEGYEAAMKLRQALANYMVAVLPFETAKPRTRKPKAASASA